MAAFNSFFSWSFGGRHHRVLLRRSGAALLPQFVSSGLGLRAMWFLWTALWRLCRGPSGGVGFLDSGRLSLVRWFLMSIFGVPVFLVDISMCLAGWKLTLRGFVVIIIIVMIILLIIFGSFKHSYFENNTGRQTPSKDGEGFRVDRIAAKNF